MINIVWVILIAGGIITGIITGNGGEAGNILFQSAITSVDLAIKLLGPMIFWMGMMKIARESGITEFLSRGIGWLLHFIFPELEHESQARGAIVMNMVANLLGLGNSATPLGIKAMQELQKLNPEPERATPAMCTLLAVNTSSITLLPITIITLRAAAGSLNPTIITVSTIFATIFSTITALFLDKTFRIFKPGTDHK